MTQFFSRNVLLISIFLLNFSGALTEFAHAQSSVIPKFRKVSEGIYRGGRPEAAGLQELQKRGIKYIINLDNDDDYMDYEIRYSSQLGMTEIPIPMSGFWYPNDEDVERALTVLRDAKFKPVFVHCYHGQDRTGLIIALHRYVNEGWTAEDAYQEMINMGFRQVLFLLKQYYEDYTGVDF